MDGKGDGAGGFLSSDFFSVRLQLTVAFVASEAVFYTIISQPPGPGINYTGPREFLLEFVILVF